ncbi:glutaredoxin family protein [Desulfovibrio sp. TomC]|uniref:glutaredoxin family protein n=1 Tax=Desulfovibrio sp. TomC TaxID=1562888 RepID=UPI001E30D2D9|nr:glutaredoxin family protein [Desulfovibrio sp. TomC]
MMIFIIYHFTSQDHFSPLIDSINLQCFKVYTVKFGDDSASVTLPGEPSVPQFGHQDSRTWAKENNKNLRLDDIGQELAERIFNAVPDSMKFTDIFELINFPTIPGRTTRKGARSRQLSLTLRLETEIRKYRIAPQRVRHAQGASMLPHVKIFTLSTCSHCTQAKEYLEARKVPYDSVSVDLTVGDERTQALDTIRRLNPELTFPTIIIGDKTVIGFRPDGIAAALREYGWETDLPGDTWQQP